MSTVCDHGQVETGLEDNLSSRASWLAYGLEIGPCLLPVAGTLEYLQGEVNDSALGAPLPMAVKACFGRAVAR